MFSVMASRTPTVEWPPRDDEVEWNETAGMAERHMRIGKLDSLTVVADGHPIGHVTRRDIERCAKNGNWLEAVMIFNLVHQPPKMCN